MARDVVDAAVADLAADGTAASQGETGSGAVAGPSLTHQTPLLGAAGYAERLASAAELAAHSGLPAAQVKRLLNRYGSCADDLLALVAGRPELGQELPGGAGYLAAEIAYACSHEGAVRLDDALARRTRIAIETRDRGLSAAPAAAAVMAAELGWDPARTQREVKEYQQSVAADLAAQAEPDEKLAYQARVATADPADFYPTAVR
jgi:glycerol-3-phosphate dehydrogenase